MNGPIYHPFEKFDFQYNQCYLSGVATDTLISTQILPLWLLEMTGFSGDERIKLLDERIVAYNELKVPVAQSLYLNKIVPLEEQISNAFLRGYEGVSALDKCVLFNWIGKFLYSLIYVEMNGAIKQRLLSSDGLNMGQGLMHKFGNLHTMLQGIFRPTVFEDFTPFTIEVFKLEDAETPFSFRDEINTMTFSMKFKDFGLIACLQDNGVNGKYHDALLAQIRDEVLNAQQFEEVCARFYYSAYLFNRLPEYNIMLVDDVVYVGAMPLRGTLSKPIFDMWQHKTYAQVLENFWKPWQHTLFEIIKDPNNPVSYFKPSLLPE